MPRKYRRKRIYRRRRFKKKNRAPNGFQAVAKIGKFIPPTMMIKLRYVQQIQLDPTVGGIPQSYYFRANSLYDPDYSSVIVGSQPYGFDQIKELGYKKYTVLGSKINIKSIQPNPSQIESTKHNQNIVASIVKTLPTNNLMTTAAIIENGESRYHFSNQTFMKSHNNYFSAKKFFGVTDVKDNEQLSADVDANPSQVAYFRIICMPVENGLDSFVTNLLITIDYLAYFHDRQTILPS